MLLPTFSRWREAEGSKWLSFYFKQTDVRAGSIVAQHVTTTITHKKTKREAARWDLHQQCEDPVLTHNDHADLHGLLDPYVILTRHRGSSQELTANSLALDSASSKLLRVLPSMRTVIIINTTRAGPRNDLEGNSSHLPNRASISGFAVEGCQCVIHVDVYSGR